MSDVNETTGSDAETEIAGANESMMETDPSTADSVSDLDSISGGESVEMPAASSADMVDTGTGSVEEDDAAIDDVPSDVEPDVTAANQVADEKDA